MSPSNIVLTTDQLADLALKLGKAGREVERLQRLGDAMADAIEARWSGPGGCDCEVCSTANAWRRARSVP